MAMRHAGFASRSVGMRRELLVPAAGAAVFGTVGILSVGAATLHPAATIGGLAVAVVVVTLLWRVDLALLVVVATGPLELAYDVQVGPLTVTKAAGGLCLLSFALYALRSHHKLVFDRSQLLVLAILIFGMLSAVQALDLGAAITTTGRYASFAAFFIVVTQLPHRPLLQRQIAWTLSGGATILAIVGLHAYFSGASLVAKPAHADANDVGFALATALPFAFWLLGAGRALRPIVVGMIAAISASAVLTLSRGALVGIGTGVLFLLVTDRRRFRLILVGGLIAAAGSLVAIQEAPGRFAQALETKQAVAQENVTSRLQAWDAAANLATTHPFLGVGPGNFRFYFDEVTGTPAGTSTVTVVHDAYLDIAAELGLAAAFAFVLYVGMTLARLTALTRAGPGPTRYAQAVCVSLVIAASCAVFLSEQYFLPFWLLGGIATALWTQRPRDVQTSRQ
jgi:putative inorganic carbon (HCO3(-)) transporter